MNPSLLEDWLEQMFFKNLEDIENVSISDLCDSLCIPNSDGDLIACELKREGLLEIDQIAGMIRLTKKGEDAARRIARKHKILECFFTEMLGLPPERASEEACTIEHEISEEAAERLSGYIHGNESCFQCMGHRRRGQHHDDEDFFHKCTNLTCYEEGRMVKVMHMPRRGHYCRLMDLGILPGERLYIKRKLANNSLVITVKDCDIAISPEIASKVFVEPVE